MFAIFHFLAKHKSDFHLIGFIIFIIKLQFDMNTKIQPILALVGKLKGIFPAESGFLPEKAMSAVQVALRRDLEEHVLWRRRPRPKELPSQT